MSLKLESYTAEIIEANSQYLLPLKAQANTLVSLELNHELYLLTMNDRGIHKLIKQGEALPLDQSPLVFKRYTDFCSISYKQLSLSCDAQGLSQFVENNVEEQTHLHLAES